MTMDAHTNHPHAAPDLGTAGPQRGVELPAALTISWSLAGGMLCGGAAVVLMILTGRLSGHLMLTASATLFALGALAGLVHGVALGILGRPGTMTVRQSIAAMAHGLLYLVPSLLLGWLVAGWVAAMPLAWTGKHFIAAAISALAWVAMIVTTYFAVSIGLRAAGLAFRRWPHRVAGSVLVGAVAATMVAAFVVQPPTIWFTHTRLTMPGALLLALLATIWFYGPVITVGLWLVQRIRPDLREANAPSTATLKRVATSAGFALAAGLLLAVIALPFYRGAMGLPSDVERLGFAGAMIMVLSQALTDELFFRLFAMTVAFVLVARLMTHGKYAVAIAGAVAVGAGLDLIVHLRDLPALGLPGALAIGSYAAVRVVIPAIVFGYLFWKRGLGTAVGAHVVSGAALGLLAL
jgi:hypothetical protein